MSVFLNCCMCRRSSLHCIVSSRRYPIRFWFVGIFGSSSSQVSVSVRTMSVCGEAQHHRSSRIVYCRSHHFVSVSSDDVAAGDGRMWLGVGRKYCLLC